MIGLQLPMLQAGAAAGVVPSPVNWDDIDSFGTGSGANATQTIRVGESILLRAEISSVISSHQASGSVAAIVDAAFAGGDALVNGAMFDFVVTDNNGVYFSASGAGNLFWSITAVVTVKYKSAGSPTFDQTLDSFSITLDQDIPE